jgi:hypothetical protein
VDHPDVALQLITPEQVIAAAERLLEEEID